MAFENKVQSENKHFTNLTSARNIHIDGTITPITVRGVAGRLQRIIVNTKGVAMTVRNGSNVIASFATTTPEGTYNYGIYCENNINVNGISGTGSVTLVFSD